MFFTFFMYLINIIDSLAKIKHIESSSQSPGCLVTIDLFINPEQSLRSESVAVMKQTSDEAEVDTREWIVVSIVRGVTAGSAGRVHVVLDTDHSTLTLLDQTCINCSVVEVGEC